MISIIIVFIPVISFEFFPFFRQEKKQEKIQIYGLLRLFFEKMKDVEK